VYREVLGINQMCDIDGNGAINISDIIMNAEKFNTKGVKLNNAMIN
jgi:hypothetical protein